MKTITCTKQAWAHSAEHLNRIVLGETKPEFHDGEMTVHGWIPLGEADVTLTLPAENDLKMAAVDALKKEIKKVTAEAAKKKMDLEEMINNLLCLTFEASDKEQF